MSRERDTVMLHFFSARKQAHRYVNMNHRPIQRSEPGDTITNVGVGLLRNKNIVIDHHAEYHISLLT